MGNITINTNSLKSAREWKRHKINDGANVYRILPPFGDVEVHNNYPYRKWSIAWLVDPQRGTRMPFATPLTDGEEKCPVKEYQDALRDYIENKKAMLKAEGMSDSAIKEALKSLHEIQWQVKVQHVYAYNACDKSGNVGLLELKSTAHKAMKKRMMEYIEKYGQDPTSLNSNIKEDSGVWFNIAKEGAGKNTEYGVEFAQTPIRLETGDTAYVVDRSPLNDTVATGYKDQGYDLNSIYRRKSYNELKEVLVHTLSILAEDCPEAVLPGFEKTNATNATNVTETRNATTTKPSASAPKAKVNLNLADTEDDEPSDFNNTNVNSRVSDSEVDDLKDFADSILGD